MAIWEKWLLFVLFAALLASTAFFCLQRYDLIVGPDDYRYVQEGMNIARGRLSGDFPLTRYFPDSPFARNRSGAPFGNTWLKDGRLYVIQPLGLPLLLALAYRLGGTSAMFLVNPILLLFLLAAQYRCAREFAGDRPGAAWMAFLSVPLLLFLPGYKLVVSSLHPSRDIPSLTFFLWAIYCLLRGVREGKGRGSGRLYAAAVLAGFACLVRETNFILLLPAVFYLIHGVRKRLRVLFPLALVFLLTLSPLLLENYLSFNRWVPQVSYLFEEESPGGVGEMIAFANFLPNLFRYARWLGHLFPPPVIFLALLGFLFFGKRREVWLLVAWPLVNLLFFSLVKFAYIRYAYPVFPVVAALAAAGASWLVGFPWGRLGAQRWSAHALVLAGLLLAAISLSRPARGLPLQFFDLTIAMTGLALIAADRFLPLPFRARVFLSQPGPLAAAAALIAVVYFTAACASRAEPLRLLKRLELARTIEEAIPEREAFLLAERNLCYTLDFHTRFTALSPDKLSAFSGLDLNDAIAALRTRGVPVYFLDNKGKSDGRRRLPYLAERFTLSPVLRLNSPALAIWRKNLAEQAVVTIYRIGESRPISSAPPPP